MAAGFPPLAAPGARVLILGTLPGALSLKANEYYAHPRNAFWPIMERVLGVSLSVPYAERTRTLMERGIALWDVLSHAERPGSLDVAIVGATAVANDFGTFFATHPEIRLVCFNGKTAAKLYNQTILLGLPRGSAPRYEILPSTSPMHTVASDEKLRRWAVIGEYLK